MTRFPGLGRRLSDRLHALGYWKDGRPDVGRFCREKGYRPQYVYAWLKDRMPAYDNVNRLCGDLGVPVVWFVVGDGAAEVRDGLLPAPSHLRRRPHGHSVAASGGPIDLSPLRDATERISSVQADLTALLGAFPDPCWWFDETGRVLEVNGAVTPAVATAAKGRSVRDVFPGEPGVLLHRAFGQAFRTNDAVTVEYTLPASGRRVRTFEARVRPVIDRSARRTRKILVVVRDVSASRERENAYRELAEGSPNGLCIAVGSTIQYANGAIARMFGFATPAELVNRDLRELLPELRPAKNQSFAQREIMTTIQQNGAPTRMTVLLKQATWRSQPATLVTILAAHPPVRSS
jgi:PAS domain-containing protein